MFCERNSSYSVYHCKCHNWEFYLPVLGNARITTFQLALPKSSVLKNNVYWNRNIQHEIFL